MIRCNLNTLLAERGLKIAKVVNDTKVSRPTLTAIAQNSGKGIQFETLNALCSYLNITPCEFFSYLPYDFKASIFDYEDTTHQSGDLIEGRFTLYISAFDKNHALSESWEFQCFSTIGNAIVGTDKNGELDTITFLDFKISTSMESDFEQFVSFFENIETSWRYSIRDHIQSEIYKYFASADFSNNNLEINTNGINQLFEKLEVRISRH